MDKIEALENIDSVWHNPDVTLGDKILRISNDFYSVGLDLSTTAAYIKATPAELDALLSMSGLDDEIIALISDVNPPKTAWSLFAIASDNEIRHALKALSENNDGIDIVNPIVSKFVYQKMVDAAGPTTEQLIGMLSGYELEYVLKRAQDYDALSEWENKFLKSIASQKKRGKTLTYKQTASMLKIMTDLAEKGIIKRDSIDDDERICNKILDALGK